VFVVGGQLRGHLFVVGMGPGPSAMTEFLLELKWMPVVESR
jgi:hypothetical protein